MTLPEYEFKCRVCGVFLLAIHPGGMAPELKEEYCPRCKTTTEQQRWYSFGTGAGSSGEPVRSVSRGAEARKRA